MSAQSLVCKSQLNEKNVQSAFTPFGLHNHTKWIERSAHQTKAPQAFFRIVMCAARICIDGKWPRLKWPDPKEREKRIHESVNLIRLQSRNQSQAHTSAKSIWWSLEICSLLVSKLSHRCPLNLIVEIFRMRRKIENTLTLSYTCTSTQASNDRNSISDFMLTIKLTVSF